MLEFLGMLCDSIVIMSCFSVYKINLMFILYVKTLDTTLQDRVICGEVNIEKKIFCNSESKPYSLIGCEKKNVTFSAHRVSNYLVFWE